MKTPPPERLCVRCRKPIRPRHLVKGLFCRSCDIEYMKERSRLPRKRDPKTGKFFCPTKVDL